MITINKYIIGDENALPCIKEARKEDLMIARYNNMIAGYFEINIKYQTVEIYVLPEFRLHGVGTCLFNEVQKICIKSGIDYIASQYFNPDESEVFAKRMGATFITSTIDMKYTGTLLPEKNWTFRNYQDEDFDRFTYIWNRGMHELRLKVGHPYSQIRQPTEEDRKELLDGINNTYALVDNNQIVAVGYINDNYISGIAVDMELHNRGYGQAVAAFLTNEILKREYTEARLCVEVGNDNAEHIYRKLGYTEVSRDYWCYKYYK